MSVNLSPIGNGVSFLGTTGLPLSGGKIYTYQAGSSTPLATYTDVNGTIANSNPIILGTDGRTSSEVWLTYGYNYKFILQDSVGSTIATYDNLYGILGTIPAASSTLPTGMILLWSGSIGSIPTGYLLCDGTNSTPDLRDRFIIGAGNTYSVNQTGGTADAIVVSHSHTATSTSTVTDPGHFHTVPYANADAIGGSGAQPAYRGSATTNVSTATTGITVATSTTTATAGTSGTGQNLPPYFALCYIMKS
jgi:microcystin-dependent protein